MKQGENTMGQRSQIYIRYDEKLIVANYYQWNYGERMISRARAAIEWMKEYLDEGHFFVFENTTYTKKLSRICDINFDMRDVAISCDIVQEWKEQFSDEPFNSIVFNQQDNNDGQLFIDISKDGKIKYCLAKNPDYDTIMDCNAYLEWDLSAEWKKPNEYRDQEAIDTCINNIEYIRSNAELMTAEELAAFVTAHY